MTIGNLSSKIRQMPSTHSVEMVDLLPIPLKNGDIPQKGLEEQQRMNGAVLNEVLRQVLQPLRFKHNPTAESGYCNVLCADANFRHCKPVLAAWHADCPVHCDLPHLERRACLYCQGPNHELGDYVPADQQHPRRDHNLYRMRTDGNTNPANAELSSCPVHRKFNVFDIFPVLWAISLCPTSSIQCRSACLTTSRSWFSTS